MSEVDIFSDENGLVRAEYRKNNYIIKEYDNDSKLVAIYFSSNGLYFPDTEECFRECIIEKNRFEWMHYKVKNVKMELYFRDIYKSWYVSGINENVNSIDKVVAFIKKQVPKESTIVTVGNSAGGYAAALVGTLINADYVFDFSGQFKLEDIRNAHLKKFSRDVQYSRYFDLMKLWNKYEAPIIFYFYAGKCQYDIIQYEYIRNCKNIFAFEFITSVHEQTMYNFNLETILSMSISNLMALHDKIGNRPISRLRFSLVACGLRNTIIGLSKQVYVRCFKMVKKAYIGVGKKGIEKKK